MNEQNHERSATGLSRRFFLKGAAVTVGGVGLGSPWLAACGGSSSTSAGNADTSAAALPTFVNALILKPDLPDSAQGVQPGYLTTPASFPKSVKKAVGSGGTVTSLVLTYNPPPPPPGDNAWLQAVNKAVNIKYSPQVTPASDYPAKFASVTAGNDLPDLVQMPLFMNLPRLPDLLEKRFADISEFVSGDKVKDYPNLAGIPTYSWKMARVRGRIYGVPLSRAVFFNPLLMRQDLLDKAGQTTMPTSLEEFEALCKAVTDPKAGRWALASDDSNVFDVPFFAQLFGAPMRWRKDAKGLVKDYETDEYAEAVAYAAKLRKAGYFHPDSGTVNISKIKDYFASGKALMYLDGASAWRASYESYAASVPGLHVEGLIPFAAKGGKPVAYFDNGIFSLLGFTKAKPERIQELLRMVDYFSAPFGSEEFQLLSYGVEGVDHTVVDGSPVLTDRGKLEQGISLWCIGAGAGVVNQPQFPDYVKQYHAYQEKIAPLGISDPTNGLYSDTNSRQGGALTLAINDAVRSVVAGRSSMSAFTEAVAKWRSGGGDTIRKEFEAELAKSA